MTLVDRFLKYVSFDTQSDESTGLTPSTRKQMIFAEYLKKSWNLWDWKILLWMSMAIFLLHFLPI